MDAPRSFIRAALCLLLLAAAHERSTAAEAESSPPVRDVIGPLVGHVSATEADLWIWRNGPGEFTVRYAAVDAWGDEAASEVAAPRRESEYGVARARLAGLRPSTRYRYEFMLTGDENADQENESQENPLWHGEFSTAPEIGEGATFTVAVSSCMKPAIGRQASWYLLLAQQPAFQLLLGDCVYTDTAEHDKIWQGHLVQRSLPEFAAVIRNLPTYAMWDDHDYGPNNSDGTLVGKENSLRAFGELWANPGAGVEGTPGAFYKFSHGDVDFFMLDGRYHRSPDAAPNDDQKRMLGDGQFAWLEEQLRASTAKFKILASGSTLKESKDDGWRIYDFARKRLYRLIAEHRIGGVLYLSGDVHRSLIRVHPKDETGGYDLHEVISSGIANSETLSFATLSFDTTRDDPNVRIRVIHGDGAIRADKTLQLSELQVR